MSVLIDRRGCGFCLQPVVPTLSGPRDAYDVAMTQDNTETFSQRFTIYQDNPDGHWNIWRLFRAFQSAEKLAGQRSPINITAEQVASLNEPMIIEVNVGWLDVVLWAETTTYCPPANSGRDAHTEQRCGVTVYLQAGPQGLHQQGELFHRFTLDCTPQEVVIFGQTLEKECREALGMRRQLAIVAPADDYIDG